MSAKHLLRHSKKVYGLEGSASRAWWYEEARGVCVVHEVWVQGVQNHTAELWIPWDRIRGALDRLNKPDNLPLRPMAPIRTRRQASQVREGESDD